MAKIDPFNEINDCMIKIAISTDFITLMIAFVASVFKDGWCLISSSIALPKLLAVSPAKLKNSVNNKCN